MATENELINICWLYSIRTVTIKNGLSNMRCGWCGDNREQCRQCFVALRLVSFCHRIADTSLEIRNRKKNSEKKNHGYNLFVYIVKFLIRITHAKSFIWWNNIRRFKSVINNQTVPDTRYRKWTKPKRIGQYAWYSGFN